MKDQCSQCAREAHTWQHSQPMPEMKYADRVEIHDGKPVVVGTFRAIGAGRHTRRHPNLIEITKSKSRGAFRETALRREARINDRALGLARKNARLAEKQVAA